MNIIWIILSFVLGVLICSATFLFCASVDYLKHLEGGEQDDESELVEHD